MKTIVWKIHLRSNPETIFELLATSKGRAKFWAETALEIDNIIHFIFPNGEHYDGRVINIIQNKEFHLDYFNSLVKFKLEPCENEGTDLTLINEGVSEENFTETHSGWVSVLLNLKAVADYQCDLRNHNPKKTWDKRYVDN